MPLMMGARRRAEPKAAFVRIGATMGALAEESRNEEPSHPAIAIRTAGGKAADVLLAWLHASKG
jgi:hypothetical protein